MAKLNLENLSDEINDESDNDTPVTSFKLSTALPKNSSKSVGALPTSMILPSSNNLPPPAPKSSDRVETLEEKIARVMAGINMPKNVPAKSPTNLPTTSPFEKFSLATKSPSISSPSPTIQETTSSSTTEQEPPAEKKRAGARIVRPGSNNSLTSLAGEEKSENNNTATATATAATTTTPKSIPAVTSTTSLPGTPTLTSPSEIKSPETLSKPKNFQESRAEVQRPVSRGIALPVETPIESEPPSANQEVSIPVENKTASIEPTVEPEKPQKTLKGGGRVVRGDSPSLPIESHSPTPAPAPIQTQIPEPSIQLLPSEKIPEIRVVPNEISPRERHVEVEVKKEKPQIIEKVQEKSEEITKEADPKPEPVVVNPSSTTNFIEIDAPLENTDEENHEEEEADDPKSPTEIHNDAPDNSENRDQSQESAIQTTTQQSNQSPSTVNTPSVPQKTARIFRPNSSNPAPAPAPIQTPTPAIVRSKSQEKTRTPSSSSVGSRSKVAPTTPTFTPQQRRIPELPSALTTVGYTPNADFASVGHQNRSNEWSITKRTEVQSISQPLTIPRYNHQLSNMFPETPLHDVKVAVRIRPFTIGEIQSGPRRVVSVNGDKLILVNPNAFDANPDAIAAAAAAVSLENMRCNDWAKVFCFDNCFWSYDPTDEGDTYVDQQGIFEEIGCTIADDILRGISTCCFAYGHTSTGKTYTMFGGDDLIHSRTKESYIESENNNGDIQLHPSAGLIPRVFMDVLNRVFADTEVLQDTKITLSFLEIHQEKIRDCLSPVNNSAELRVREHPALGPYIENLTRVEVESVRDVLELLYRGYEERSTASTLRNRHSSRSHAIATLELSPVDAQDPFAQSSARKPNSSIPQPVQIQKHPHVRCQMVDLAGSEKDFDVEPATPTRRRHSGDSNNNQEKLELKMIRRSLSTLGYIIKALGQGNSPKGLPFRDSVLTWLLKDALSGQSKTTMLATISPSHTCYDETLQTLKYAERLCQINPSAKPGMESTARVSINDTIDPELSYALANEYSKLKQELGGSKPGSIAAKHLLQQTISDPQQRLAKLEPYRANYVEEDARYQSNNSPGDDRYSVIPVSAKKPTRGGGGGGGGGYTPLSHSYNGSLMGSNDILIEQDLKEAYRQLHGKYVELQIELENTRTDRDSMNLDIKKLQESLERSESEKYLGSKSALNDMTLALRSAEAEVNELRGVILRKEETSDRLLGELADERQARETVEKTARAQVTELINRLETLHRQGQNALKESQHWQQEANILQQEKELLGNQIQSLKDLLQERTQESDKKIHTLEDEVRLSMEHVNTVIKERDRTNSEITLILKEKAEMAAREVSLTKRIQELVLEVERAQNESKLKSELEIIKLQRDSLFEMIKQQENALQLQQKQSESSLKMLHQRQAALDRYEQKYYNENDELSVLQENLQKLLNYEGELLQNEVIDAKKLLHIISDIKERVMENNYLKEDISRLESEKNELYLKNKDIERKYETILKEYRDCSEQLEHSKKLTIDWETRAHYWQQVSKKTTTSGDRRHHPSAATSNENPFNQSYESSVSNHHPSNISMATAVNGLDSNELKSENIRLQELLNSTQQELENSKLEFETSKNDLQKEFSSLWMAVEQLNKLDASKDKTIRELTVERDNAVREAKEITKRYKEMKREFDGLQSELQSIDLNLLDVADHEGIEVSDILNVVHDHHPHVNNVLRSSSRERPHVDRLSNAKSPRQRGGGGGPAVAVGSGLSASYAADSVSRGNESIHERDSDIVSEPGYFRTTESRQRHVSSSSSSRGEKRSIQNQRRERSVSPSSSRRRTQAYNNEKGLEMQIEELSQYLTRDPHSRNQYRTKLRNSREY